MTDSRNLPVGGNFQSKPNSKNQKSFFDEINEQFEILYQNAIGKSTGLTNETTAADGVTRKNTSCHEMHYEATMTRQTVKKPVKDITSSPTLSVRERCLTMSRSPLKSRRLSLNHTYPLDRRTSLSQVSPVKSERSSLVSARKRDTEPLPRSKGKDIILSVSSKKNSSKVSVSNTCKENQDDERISSSPVKSVCLSVTTNPSNSSVETSNLTFDKKSNEPTTQTVDSNLTIENDKELSRTAISVHDNQLKAISDHGSTSNGNQNMTKPSKAKRQIISQVKPEAEPKSKRFKMNEHCSKVTQSTSPVNKCDKTIELRRKSRKPANVKQKKVQYQDSKDKKIPHQHVNSEGSNKSMKVSSRNSGNGKMGRVKSNMDESMSIPSSTSESQSNNESKGFVYTTEESLSRQGRNNQVHSAVSQISSVVELDEVIPLQSMKSSRVPDRPIWSSILSQFKT